MSTSNFHRVKVTAKAVKELRDLTGVGMMEARDALTEAEGDVARAQEILRKKGQAKARKKAERETRQGRVHSYIHDDGRLGVLVEVNCETDFVARNNDFKALVHDLALHIAASSPLYVSRSEVPAEIVEKEKEIYKAQVVAEKKSAEIMEKIIAGKLGKYFQEICLLEQPFVKNPDIIIHEHIAQKIATIGENIQVRRFVRYRLGE